MAVALAGCDPASDPRALAGADGFEVDHAVVLVCGARMNIAMATDTDCRGGSVFTSRDDLCDWMKEVAEYVPGESCLVPLAAESTATSMALVRGSRLEGQTSETMTGVLSRCGDGGTELVTIEAVVDTLPPNSAGTPDWVVVLSEVAVPSGDVPADLEGRVDAGHCGDAVDGG